MRRAKAGAVVTYTVVLINGATAVPANSSLTIAGSLPNLTISISNCALNMANGTAANVTMALPGNTALVCTIPVTVSASDIVNTKLPSFKVTMSASGNALSVSATADPVLLYTRPSITVSPLFTGTFATGEYTTKCVMPHLGNLAWHVRLLAVQQQGNNAVLVLF